MQIILSAEEKKVVGFLIEVGKKNIVTLSDGSKITYTPEKDKSSLRVDYPDGVHSSHGGPTKALLKYLGLEKSDSDEW